MLELIVLGQVPGTSYAIDLTGFFVLLSFGLVIAKFALNRKDVRGLMKKLNKQLNHIKAQISRSNQQQA